MGRLNTYVHVVTAEQSAVFGPDDDVPAWAVEAITNPSVWEGGEVSSEGVPPRGGAGSGRAAWVAYAEAQGVAVGVEATRDEIVSALDASGVPTE